MAATFSSGAKALTGGYGVGTAIAAGAIGAAAGSVVSQGVGVALGVQQDFNWKQVALSAVAGGAAGAVAGSGWVNTSSTIANATLRTAMGNAVSQGVAVATGLQSSFNWRGVAAAAAGGAAGALVGQALSAMGTSGADVQAAEGTWKSAQAVAQGSLQGFAAGLTTAAMRGGRVSVTQVAVDAFGNALGEGLKDSMLSGGNGGYDYGDASNQSAAEDARLSRYEASAAVNARQQADFDQIVAALGQPNQIDRSGDIQLAANGRYAGVDPGSVESLRGADGVYRVEIVGTSTTPDRYGAGGGVSSSAGSGNDVAGLAMLDAQAASSDAAQTAVSTSQTQLQQSIDQQVIAGTYPGSGTMAMQAIANGNLSEAWTYLNYAASDEAKAATNARLFPTSSPQMQRVDAMLASPIGAAASVVGRMFGASQHTQDALLATGSVVEQLAGAGTGIYKQTLTAAPPMATVLGAKPRGIGPYTRDGTTFGASTSTDYRTTFFDAYPSLQGQVVVHHAVEQQTLQRYPGVVRTSEIHSLENLRGIPIELNSSIHLSGIRVEWNRFYRSFAAEGKVPTQSDLLQKATEIDNKFGSRFMPPIEGNGP